MDRRSFCKLALGAMIFGPGCASEPSLVVSYDDRVRSAGLQLYDGSEPKVYKLSREEGLACMRDLAVKADREEAWLFVPKLGEWLDVGRPPDEKQLQTYRGQGFGEALASASIDNQMLGQVAIGVGKDHLGEMELWHIHPDSALEGFLDLHREKNGQLDERQTALLNHRWEMSKEYPSTLDVFQFLDFNRRLGHTDLDVRFSSGVCASNGYTLLCDARLDETFTEKDALAYCKTLRSKRLEVLNAIREPRDSLEEDVKKMASAYESNLYQLAQHSF